MRLKYGGAVFEVVYNQDPFILCFVEKVKGICVSYTVTDKNEWIQCYRETPNGKKELTQWNLLNRSILWNMTNDQTQAKKSQEFLDGLKQAGLNLYEEKQK